ncbi:MAG: 16S rRNA (guanine(527)-N(7))-methyltransferase RsmG [Lachnospiraceae bacterium]|nr:16S rRNA (guanine(527)-N(7))-methyltransferase RsmG [Lachnospiraceae bacterium]
MEFLKNALKEINIVADENKLMQLLKFYDMIVEKNKVMNLTAITDFEEFVTKHIVDSLEIIRVIDLSGKSLKMIDIGTGAGFPGIPLKIIYPDLEVTLFDSLKKRLVFLDEVIMSLSLKNIRTVHGRAEEYGRKNEYREKYDLVVSRAVADMTPLCELCIPFCKVNGLFISYKGSKGYEELQKAEGCIKILGGEKSKVSEFSLDSSKRFLLSILKKKPTDNKYPRGSGKPFKSPLYIETRICT